MPSSSSTYSDPLQVEQFTYVRLTVKDGLIKIATVLPTLLQRTRVSYNSCKYIFPQMRKGGIRDCVCVCMCVVEDGGAEGE